MICHKHKCIFVHIPRTAGTSVEQAIRPDWSWESFKEEKHILASTAKTIYKEYWDDYFKFSFIRNPWDRMVSMSKYSYFYGCEINNGKLDVSDYKKKFPQIEIDSRSKSVADKYSPISNAVYLNILNEELDFIGRFEKLQEDYNKVCSTIGCTNKLGHKEQGEEKANYTKFYTEDVKKVVGEVYKKDIEYFGYEFGK